MAVKLNSCLYEYTVMHHRLEPKKHRFVYNVFMFSLDLDEIDTLCEKLFLFSRNRFNVFNFRDTDHLSLGKENVKENIFEYLRQNGIALNKGKIILVTNLRTFGYVFNPVSFYFCFDENGNPICAIPEVGNTFGEMKPYLLKEEDKTASGFRKMMTKYFYVSPFIELDTEFDFQLNIPNEKLQIVISDYAKGKKMFLSSLVGTRKELTNARLLWYTFRFPLITLQVITLIHWQALKLYLKKLPFLRKNDNPELQKGAVVWNK